MGITDDINEMLWNGREPRLTSEEISEKLDDIFSPRTALERILWAIIKSNPDGKPIDTDRPKEKNVEWIRLEQAMSILTGASPSRGNPTVVKFDLLYEIAKQYWLAYAGRPEDNDFLGTIAKRVVLSEEQKRTLASDEKDSIVKPYIDAFKKNIDVLLLTVSSVGLPEAEFPKGRVCDILKHLVQLGVVSEEGAGDLRNYPKLSPWLSST